MEPMEVIDLSSDDEKSPPKNRDIAPGITSRKKEVEIEKKNIGLEDVEIVYNLVKNQKRRAAETEKENRLKLKRMKFPTEGDHPQIVSNLLIEKSEVTLHRINKIKPETLSPRCTAGLFESDKSNKSNDNSSSSTGTKENDSNLLNNDAGAEEKPSSPNSQKNTRSLKINEGASSSTGFVKPQLTIKNKIELSESVDTNSVTSAEVFKSFLDKCRSQDPSTDMEIIISKLRKRYNNLQPSYAKSGHFIRLICKKRDLIANDRSKLYLHISEVMAEMKARLIQNKVSVKGSSERNTTKERPSVQSGVCDIPEEELDKDESMVIDFKDIEKLKALEKAMRRCERLIKKCETAEVNFDDEKNSHFIIGERYKGRMIELYNKYCEITGESPDAARPYLRPKYLSVTSLPPLNNAITSFINTKITNMKKSLINRKKDAGQLRFTDALIFPDYIDILNCVTKCNEEQNLQLNKTQQESIAKDAFSELGAYLQRCRQLDYYDTFSLHLEKDGCDPAATDESLAQKLNSNREMGKKKLDQVFQYFVEKQNAATASENESYLEKDEDVGTGDESPTDSDDQSSETSEDEEIGIEQNSDPQESKTNNLNHKDNDDVELDEPKHDLNERDDQTVTVDKPQDDLNRKSNPIVEQYILPDHLDKKVNEDVELGELQGDLNHQCNMNIELDTDVDANKESLDGQDPISIQTAGEVSMNMDTSESVEDKIVDNIEVRKEKDTEMMLATAVLAQTETNRIAIDQMKIDEKVNKTADPRDSKKTASRPIQIKQQVSTVTRYKVNVMQAAKTLEINSNDGCSPATSANNTKVIDASRMAMTVKPIHKEDERKPILRLRQFAKPPGSWKDFQSPTKSLEEKSKTDGTADASRETIKVNKTLLTKDQANKLIKLTNLIPVGKTVQVKNGILMNLKDKKSTVIIPTTLDRNHPKISVQTVTNNVTFNFSNQVQLEPKIASVVSRGLKPKPTQNFVKIDEHGKITTRCNNAGIITIGSNEVKISKNPNPTQTVDNNNRQILPIKKPATQVSWVGQKTTGGTTQQRYQIVQPKNAAIGEGTIVRRIPLIVERGKKTIVRLVNGSPGGKSQNIIIPGKATVVQNQACTPNQRLNSNSSVVPIPNLKLKVSNSNKQTFPSKVYQSSSKLNKLNKTPTDSVPTYVIE